METNACNYFCFLRIFHSTHTRYTFAPSHTLARGSRQRLFSPSTHGGCTTNRSSSSLRPHPSSAMLQPSTCQSSTLCLFVKVSCGQMCVVRACRCAMGHTPCPSSQPPKAVFSPPLINVGLRVRRTRVNPYRSRAVCCAAAERGEGRVHLSFSERVFFCRSLPPVRTTSDPSAAPHHSSPPSTPCIACTRTSTCAVTVVQALGGPAQLLSPTCGCGRVPCLCESICVE
jgi:hypothetical protein